MKNDLRAEENFKIQKRGTAKPQPNQFNFISYRSAQRKVGPDLPKAGSHEAMRLSGFLNVPSGFQGFLLK